MKISEEKIRRLIRDEISERKLRKNISSYINEVLSSKAVAKGTRGDGGGGWRRLRNEPSEEDEETVDVSSASGDAAANAETEFAKWGGKNETDPSMKDVLVAYWNNVGASAERYISSRQPWSAAFISWALQNEPGFQGSAGHRTYMRNAKKARDRGATTGFVAYKPEELESGPERGDIVCRPRGTGDGWGSIGAKNHCDIYVGGGTMIGGNLGDTSKKAPYDAGKASMVIKKLAESTQLERITESVVRDTILKIIEEEKLSEVLKSDASAGGQRGSSSGGAAGARREMRAGELHKKGDHDPFQMSSDIHPSSWDSSVAGLWDKLDGQAKKFIMAMPSAIAALGFARDEADAKKKASMVIGGTYRSNAGQASAVYGGPYLNDLQGRATGCKPGAYYFVRGDTCAAKPGGVYGTSGKYADIFKKYEEITGFGSSPTLPDNWQQIWQSKKSAASAAGAAILGPDTGEGKGHGSGKAIDSVPAGGGIAGQTAMIDKAATISGTSAHKYKEVDHIHITVTEEKELLNLIQEILSEKDSSA